MVCIPTQERGNEINKFKLQSKKLASIADSP